MSELDFKRSLYAASMFGCLLGSTVSSLVYWFGEEPPAVTFVMMIIGSAFGILWVLREKHLADIKEKHLKAE